MNAIPPPIPPSDPERGATPAESVRLAEPPTLPAIVAESFGRLNIRLRARMLGRLLASVGPLALAVVGGGAFAKYVRHAHFPEIPVSFEDAARATSHQVYELARYIQQSDPQLFGRLLDVLCRDTATIASISASIAALTISGLSANGARAHDGGKEPQR
jgi:hypothetical protein